MRLVGLFVLIASAMGCGPSHYVLGVALDARRAVDAAREAKADRYAPYEWTLAWEYLVMAREMGARAHYQEAVKYGDKSSRMAREARHVAEEAVRHGGATHAADTINATPSMTPARAAEQHI